MSFFHFDRQTSAPKNDRFFRLSAANFPALKAALQDWICSLGKGATLTSTRTPHNLTTAYRALERLVSSVLTAVRTSISMVPEDAAFIPQGCVHWIENSWPDHSGFMLVAAMRGLKPSKSRGPTPKFRQTRNEQMRSFFCFQKSLMSRPTNHVRGTVVGL